MRAWGLLCLRRHWRARARLAEGDGACTQQQRRLYSNSICGNNVGPGAVCLSEEPEEGVAPGGKLVGRSVLKRVETFEFSVVGHEGYGAAVHGMCMGWLR